MKKIAVLTSGGDAPGMNACIRAVVRTAKYYGLEIMGIRRGYSGLLENDMVEMHMRSVSDILHRGGTMLRTARCKEMLSKQGRKKAAKILLQNEIEGLIVIGGNGSFMGAKALTEEFNIPCIGIPGTIDNDLGYTDYTLGFDTAVNTCIDIVNKLRDTMASHERINIVEVMGRSCGDIALYTGIASGAEIIVVPEVQYDIEDIVFRICRSREKGKVSNIIVLAEGVCKAEEFAKLLKDKLKYSIRCTTIGHIQRGGSPTMADRLLAAQFGVHAVELLKEGIGNRVVGIKQNKIIDLDIIEALNAPESFDIELYKTMQRISM